jgi:methylenetetrahydrofolate reductase (NADH)
MDLVGHCRPPLDQPGSKPVFDIDSVGLAEMGRRLRDRQELMSGHKIAGKAHFPIGTADSPINPPPAGNPPASRPRSMPARSLRVARRYAQCLMDNGMDAVPPLIGISLLRSARPARFIRDKLPGSLVPMPSRRLECTSEPIREGPTLPRIGGAAQRNPRGGGCAHHGTRH